MDDRKKSNSTRNYAIGTLGLITAFGIGYYWWSTSQQKKRAKRLLLCGAPGSGKGTQCEKLVEKHGYVHLSTGDILRAAVADKTELGLKAKTFMDKGLLVPDELVIGVVNDKMKSPSVIEHGWILDGFPRTKEQAKALSESGMEPEKIFVLDVKDEVLFERVTGRRSDPITGKIYHLKNKPPENEEVKKRLVQRSDDTAEKLGTRLKGYHENIDFILEWYRGKSPVVRLDGEKPADVVYKEIEKEIHK